MNSINPLIPGFGLVFFAALCGGAYGLPLRLRRRYQVENMMILAVGLATIVIPLIAAQLLLPRWPSAIAAAGVPAVAAVIGFGFGWGVGSATFALGITTIGLSLAYAIIMGINTAVGSVIPMVRRWDEIPPIAKEFVLLGIAVCIVGVAICGKAGIVRERAAESAGGASPEGTAATGGRPAGKIFLIGLGWCIVSGILSACANLGFDFAAPVAKEAARLGANEVFASLSRWLAMYWGGYLAILVFFGSKMLKQQTWKSYSGPGAGHDFGLAVLMGVFHFLAQIPYGMGAWYIGEKLGTTVGWAVNIACSLIVANLLGFITGEWRKAPRGSVNTLYLGLCVLVVAMVILAYGNSLASH